MNWEAKVMSKDLEGFPGGLGQQYAQIVLGFLVEAVIQWQAFKEKSTSQEAGNIIISTSLQSVIKKIETAFGEIAIDQEHSEQYQQPIITWLELKSNVTEYLARFNIKIHMPAFKQVMMDLLKMKILISGGIVQPEKDQNPRYLINTEFFTKQEIAKVSVDIKTALHGRLNNYYKNEIAQVILLTLSRCAGLSDEELQSLPPEVRNNVFSLRYGRGTLLWRVKGLGSKRIGYNTCMKTIDALVAGKILIEGCSEFHEFIILNPLLKPFSVIAEVIKAIQDKKRKQYILEAEVRNGGLTPFESMVNLSGLGGGEKDIHIFEGFVWSMINF